MKIQKILVFLALSLVVSIPVNAQAKSKKENSSNAVKFENIVTLKATSVKSQDRTGTCWNFATTSFLESELLRMGKGDFDLSEMYTVRHTYPRKAQTYVRYHGKNNLDQGGQAHDVMDTWKEFGIVPDEVYPGFQLGYNTHNHSEMVAAVKAFAEVVIQRKTGTITPVWEKALGGILDAYLGDDPKTFEYKGKKYTPQSFAAELEINPDDYIEFTSYSIYPMWEKVNVEVPDNWSNGLYYNVPLDDFMDILYHSIENGYSVSWDGDVSDKYCSTRAGAAIVPVDEHKAADGEIMDFLKQVHKQKPINQNDRDQAFYDYQTTDDHLMHLTGIAKDQNGTKYFLTKNSHGPARGYDGYLYMSDSFVRLRTIAYMVHKDAVPAAIKAKLGIK